MKGYERNERVSTVEIFNVLLSHSIKLWICQYIPCFGKTFNLLDTLNIDQNYGWHTNNLSLFGITVTKKIKSETTIHVKWWSCENCNNVKVFRGWNLFAGIYSSLWIKSIFKCWKKFPFFESIFQIYFSEGWRADAEDGVAIAITLVSTLKVEN